MKAISAPSADPIPVVRRIVRVERTPEPQPGFIGEGHEAVEVLHGGSLAARDPFVLLMDDRLAISPRRAIGGPHPHAGLETVTLVLSGSLRDRDEGDLSSGDAVWMTAGSGVVHNEHVEAEGDIRVLQLWIGLPRRHRFAEPALQVLRAADQPVHRGPGVVARLYSGSLGELCSATRNLVPVTLAELTLEPGATFPLELSASETGFLYVLSGEITSGEAVTVRAGELGWLDREVRAGRSTLPLAAGSAWARVVLYAGEPHREPLVQHGPFVADSEAAITRFFLEYRAGRFPRLSELAAR